MIDNICMTKASLQNERALKTNKQTNKQKRERVKMPYILAKLEIPANLLTLQTPNILILILPAALNKLYE